jgi:GT2 family glycosyltransferase
MPTGDAIKTALVIPVYNRRETTLQGLRSLSRADTSGLEVRIFVVDDASPDGTADAVAREFPDIELIHGTGNLHYAAGTNRGIEAALEWGAEYVVTMNDDSVFHEQFLQRLVAAAKQQPKAVIGALLLLWNEPHKVFQVGQNWQTWKGGWQIPGDWTAFSVPQTPFEVGGLAGNCLLIPANAIRQCGPMDEKNFPHGWGDTQWTTTLKKGGWRLLVEPRALVWCEPNTYPPPLSTLAFTERLKVLFIDQRHPVNLKRQFDAMWHSAPSKSAALAAFTVHCGNLVLKAIGSGKNSH